MKSKKVILKPSPPSPRNVISKPPKTIFKNLIIIYVVLWHFLIRWMAVGMSPIIIYLFIEDDNVFWLFLISVPLALAIFTKTLEDPPDIL